MALDLVAHNYQLENDKHAAYEGVRLQAGC